MKLWVLAALGMLIATVFALLYVMNSLESHGAGAFGVVNTIGLVTVALGIVVAALVLRRSSRG